MSEQFGPLSSTEGKLKCYRIQRHSIQMCTSNFVATVTPSIVLYNRILISEMPQRTPDTVNLRLTSNSVESPKASVVAVKLQQ